MVDDKLVAPADRNEHRCDDVLGNILDSLAARADEVVVMLGVAGDVGRHVPVALEAAGHSVLDLLLEGAIDSGPPDGRMDGADPVVELLRGKGALRRCKGLGDDDPLLGAPAAARRESSGD